MSLCGVKKSHSDYNHNFNLKDLTCYTFLCCLYSTINFGPLLQGNFYAIHCHKVGEKMTLCFII